MDNDNSIKVIFYSRTDPKLIQEVINKLNTENIIFAIDVSGLEKKAQKLLGFDESLVDKKKRGENDG